MNHWDGRAHVETLRLWPDLVGAVARLESRHDLFQGALLIGSLSRGEGDAISDIDLVAVTRAGSWQQAWDERHTLSAGALITFDRSEGKQGIAGHSWLTPSLVKVECLVTEPGVMRLRGNVVAIAGPDDIVSSFERMPPFTRRDIDDYAANLRETDAISDVERAYGDLITLLRRQVRSAPELDEPLG
ncbi:MAG TPA: hypothetical protein VGH82_13540 [Gaiellaceae bacterium]